LGGGEERPNRIIRGCATELLSIVQAHERPFQQWSIPQQIIRGMTVELPAAFAKHGEAMTPDMLHLLAWAAGLPADFIRDPLPVYSGEDGKGRGADSKKKIQAIGRDIEHIRAHGAQMSVNALAQAVGVSRKAIENWRKEEPLYRDAIRLHMFLNEINYQQNQGASPGKK
jgi:hypothetical protein